MRTLAKMVWLEIKLFAREPITLIFTLALPLLILMVLGGIFRGHPIHSGRYVGIRTMNYYLPGYIGLVLASLGTISLPVHLAGYRERGILRRFRASGMKEWAMLASQTLVSIAIAIVGSLLLYALGAGAYSVHAPGLVRRRGRGLRDQHLLLHVSRRAAGERDAHGPGGAGRGPAHLVRDDVPLRHRRASGPAAVGAAGRRQGAAALPRGDPHGGRVERLRHQRDQQVLIVAAVGLVATAISLRVFRWE